MSYYYKYNFVSPEGIYAIVQEEFKSYMDTGAIDNLMFPTYLDKALRKLGRSSYVISEELLFVGDFQARLPDNFFAVREAWLCVEASLGNYQQTNSFYSQTASTTVQVSPVVIDGDSCADPVCTNPVCGECAPDIIQAVYKTNQQATRSYKKQYLLKPGNISAKRNCGVEYVNSWDFYDRGTTNNGQFTPSSASYDSFDIRDNKFVTNFRYGAVYLIFYATEYDNIGNQMVPDNYRIKEYIEAFIKYKLIETLINQINDETFNQLQQKLVYYKQLYEESFIMADLEVKKQDIFAKQRRIVQDLNRFNMYELPNRTNRYGLRRNT